LRHDPERNAAAYLGGLLKGARRRMFEHHMVDCEDCWREVDLGRKGRSIAESGRELAPQPLRDRVRLAVETITPRRRRPRWAFGAGAVVLVVAVVAVVMLLTESDPREIEAALAAFRSQRVGAPVEPQLPQRLGQLELVRSGRTDIDGMGAVAHTYVDPSGDEVVVFVADKQWPVAAGAEHDNAGQTWIAEKDDLVLICIDEPAPSLVVGDDVHDVELAAYSLRP
jgi:hypothetical protein